MKKSLFVPLVILALMLTACTADTTGGADGAGTASAPNNETKTVTESAPEKAETLYLGADEEAPVEPDIPPEETSESGSVVSSAAPAREDPPQLTAAAGDNSVVMAKNGYTWQAAVDDEVWETIACGNIAYMACELGIAPELLLTGADTIVIDLPDDAEITSAMLYISDSEGELLEVSGGTVALPKQYGGVNAFAIEISFPEGECEYVFSGVYE